MSDEPTPNGGVAMSKHRFGAVFRPFFVRFPRQRESRKTPAGSAFGAPRDRLPVKKR